MRKLLRFCLTILLCVVSVITMSACGKKDLDIDIYMPDGAPALAMAKLMYDDNEFGNDIDYNVVASNNIGNYIIQEKADIAIVPVNMASKLIGQGDKYKMVATVTNGNLYIVGNRDISTLEDLKGEVVGVIGQGNVPDLNLKYLLSNNSDPIDNEVSETTVGGKVALKYFNSASDLLPILKQNKMNFALLPEPAVSKLLTMATNFHVELNIQELWSDRSYPQAVMIAKNDICENEDLINSIIDEMIVNESWILENTSSAIDAINDELEDGLTPSLQSTLSATTIANCNIKVKTMTAEEVTRIKAYLEGIRTIAPNAIGNYTDNMFCSL